MKYATILLALTILVFAGCGGEQQNSANSGMDESIGSSGASTVMESTTDGELRTVTINTSSGEEVKVRVEVADDTAEQAQGLMNRTSLGEDRGMLFVFGSESPRAFWMKNTLIPLSIAYIDSEGRIVDIQKMQPVGREQDVSDAQLPRYVSAEPAQYALEANQGFFEERSVEVGDTVELPG